MPQLPPSVAHQSRAALPLKRLLLRRAAALLEPLLTAEASAQRTLSTVEASGDSLPSQSDTLVKYEHLLGHLLRRETSAGDEAVAAMHQQSKYACTVLTAAEKPLRVPRQKALQPFLGHQPTFSWRPRAKRQSLHAPLGASSDALGQVPSPQGRGTVDARGGLPTNKYCGTSSPVPSQRITRGRPSTADPHMYNSS